MVVPHSFCAVIVWIFCPAPNAIAGGVLPEKLVADGVIAPENVHCVLPMNVPFPLVTLACGVIETVAEPAVLHWSGIEVREMTGALFTVKDCEVLCVVPHWVLLAMVCAVSVIA